jgi:cystathionine beta-lyase/cystathionine gamma-synthase
LGSRADAGAGNQAASFGVEAELIRFSVGLEDTAQLTATFESALASLSAA